MSKAVAHSTVAILVELRQYIDDGLVQEAAQRVAELEQAGIVIDSKIDKARYLALKSEIHYRRAEYSKALSEAQEGLALVKTTGENTLIAELQSTAAQSLTELGRIGEAEKVYRDLVSTYRRLDNTVGIIRSLNRLSRVYFIKSQFDKAVECLLEAGDYARQHDDRKWLARTKGNLGTILNLTGEFHNAIEFLNDSAALNRSLDDRLNLCRTQLSLSFAQMHVRDYASAQKSLATASALIDSGDFIAERVTLDQYRAQLALLRSDPETALTYAQSGLQRACDATREGASVCQLERLIAEAYYKSGDLGSAKESARVALSQAAKLDQKAEIGACHRLLALVASDENRCSDSDKSFAQAIAQLTQCGARFELALTYLAWSRLTADNNTASEYRYLATGILSSLKLYELYLRQPRVKSSQDRDEVALVGEDQQFLELVQQAQVCADSDIPVLLLGETGSGKDQFARFVHYRSKRRKQTLVQVNCAAIPLELAESELFGYEKGAFTNASESKTGLIEAADGGTLFLNEIGDLPLKLQAKLLAALEEKRFFKLGSTAPRRVDFRLVAATNVDLLQAVRDGRFRSDLYYRLAVMTLNVPRLADRGNDAFRLFRHFMELEQIELDNVNPAIINSLQQTCSRHDWPGNVRELKNHVELFSLTERRDPERICRRLIAKLTPKEAAVVQPATQLTLTEELELLEKSRIGQALGSCGGVIRRAASFLGLPEATLRSKMKKYRMSAA